MSTLDKTSVNYLYRSEVRRGKQEKSEKKGQHFWKKKVEGNNRNDAHGWMYEMNGRNGEIEWNDQIYDRRGRVKNRSDVHVSIKEMNGH